MKREVFLEKLEQLESTSKKRKASNRVVRVFSDVHLGNSHEGLAKIAKKEKIDVGNLSLGEFVVFVNTKKTMLKMYAPGNVIAHLRLPDGVVLDMRIIKMIPRFFNGGEINYRGALREFVTKTYPLSEINFNSNATH